VCEYWRPSTMVATEIGAIAAEETRTERTIDLSSTVLIIKNVAVPTKDYRCHGHCPTR